MYILDRVALDDTQQPRLPDFSKTRESWLLSMSCRFMFYELPLGSRGRPTRHNLCNRVRSLRLSQAGSGREIFSPSCFCYHQRDSFIALIYGLSCRSWAHQSNWRDPARRVDCRHSEVGISCGSWRIYLVTRLFYGCVTRVVYRRRCLVLHLSN